IDHLPPETIARAGKGDAAALKTYDERRLSRVGRGSPDQRPSMGQDMMKGRRTEIEFLNGFVVREGEQVGIQARANERLVDIVKRVERGGPASHHRAAAELKHSRDRGPSCHRSRDPRWLSGSCRFGPGSSRRAETRCRCAR